MKKKILMSEMELGKTYVISYETELCVTRVPGGFLYRSNTGMCFVSYSDIESSDISLFGGIEELEDIQVELYGD
jgi:hypothetical protein